MTHSYTRHDVCVSWLIHMLLDQFIFDMAEEQRVWNRQTQWWDMYDTHRYLLHTYSYACHDLWVSWLIYMLHDQYLTWQSSNAFETGSRSDEICMTHIDIYGTHTVLRVMVYRCDDLFRCCMISMWHCRVATRLKPAAAMMRYVWHT